MTRLHHDKLAEFLHIQRTKLNFSVAVVPFGWKVETVVVKLTSYNAKSLRVIKEDNFNKTLFIVVSA